MIVIATVQKAHSLLIMAREAAKWPGMISMIGAMRLKKRSVATDQAWGHHCF